MATSTWAALIVDDLERVSRIVLLVLGEETNILFQQQEEHHKPLVSKQRKVEKHQFQPRENGARIGVANLKGQGACLHICSLLLILPTSLKTGLKTGLEEFRRPHPGNCSMVQSVATTLHSIGAGIRY